MRAHLDRIARGLAWLLLRIFFRSIEVSGSEQIPRQGPVVFVANHGNSLIDPFLLVGFLPRPVRFLAKSTLWKNPAVLPLLLLGGVVPVYRQQDGSDMTRNDDTFARCHETLVAGGCVALFPEGISYDEPELQPVKTGAARIALEAEQRFGPLGVRIIPVGLVFEDKQSFRSRVLLQVGAPIDPTPESELARSDERAAARALTERIEEGLRAVTLNRPSWRESRLVERAADLYSDESSAMPGRPDLAERFPLRHAFGKRYDTVRARDPERLERVERTALRYDAMLEALGLRDDQVTAKYPLRQTALYMGDRLPILLLWMPVAFVGTLLNYLPYRAAGLVAARTASGDLPATYKLLTAFFLMPVVWVLEALAAGAAWGTAAGVWMGLIAPLSGYAALLVHERNESLSNEIRAFLTLHLRKGRAAELRAMRASLREEIRALAEEATLAKDP